MASSITLKVGPLTAVLSSTDDTAVQAVLTNYAYAVGGTPQNTNQELLDMVNQSLVRHLISVARDKAYQLSTETQRQDAINNLHW